METTIRLKPADTILGTFGHYYQERKARIWLRPGAAMDIFAMLKEAAELTDSEFAEAEFKEGGQYRKVTYYRPIYGNPEMWVACRWDRGWDVRGPDSTAEFQIDRTEYLKYGYGQNVWHGSFTGDRKLIDMARYNTFMQVPAGYGVGSLTFLTDSTFTAQQSASCD